MSGGVLISFLHYRPVWGQGFCLGAKLTEWEGVFSHSLGKGVGGVDFR